MDINIMKHVRQCIISMHQYLLTYKAQLTTYFLREDNHGLNPDDIAAYKRKKAEKRA